MNGKTPRTVLLHFFRSPLGLVVLSFDGLFFLALSLSRWLSAPLAVLGFFVGAVLFSLILLQTPLGGQAVVAEADREQREKDARVLGAVAAARKRLSLLRIENPPLKSALQELVFSSGRYLDAAVKGSPRDPEIEAAVLASVEVVGDYLAMLDAISSARLAHSSSEERSISDPGPQLERSCRALEAATREINERLAEGRASISDRISAREDLR